jgi:acetyltransferase-like isoleucine patch superfamily enzyme
LAFSGRLAAYGLALTDRFASAVKTADAKRAAVVGAKSRVYKSGRVVNLNGERERIRIGANCLIAGQVLVFAHAGSISIGDWVFIGTGTRIWSSNDLRIGDRVLISHGVDIHDTDSHPLAPEARFAQTKAILTRGHPRVIDNIRSAPIIIGNDVWIGFGATILKGVTIGDRAIIGARAFVDQDVPADGMIKAIKR